MASTQKTVVTALMSALAAALFMPSVFAVAAAAPEPVVVWDGATNEFNFANLTRTVGDNTYTLNLHENTTDANSSYILIGSEDKKAGVTITATNTDPAVTNAFGESGAVSVIMKCSGLNLSDTAFRGVIGVLSDEGGYSRESTPSVVDNNIKVGLTTANRTLVAGEFSYFIRDGNCTADLKKENSASFGTGRQTICLTYDSASGANVYLNGNLISSAEITFGNWLTPVGVVLGGVDRDGSFLVYAQKGMKIEAVAVFASELNSDEVANYRFPGDELLNVTTDTTVSAINSQFGPAKEIDLYVEKGVTITGDTIFNATNIKFHCVGSFMLKPPAGNTAVFDFSDVMGNPIITYEGVLPAISGTVFTSNTIPTWVTSAADWTGTIWLKHKTIIDFDPNLYGNTNSTLRLSGITAYFKNQTTPLEVNPAIELVNDSSLYGLNVNNGYSRDTSNPNRYIVFSKLKGDGELWTNETADKVLINVLGWSEFEGKIQLVKKIVVFGDTVPPVTDFNTPGAIYISSEATVAVPAGKQWRAVGGIHVYGTFKAADLGETQIRSDTTNFIYDTGIFTLTNAGTVDDSETDYARITGTGKLRYEGTGEYRVLSNINFPTNMITEIELAGDRGGLGLWAPSANYTHTIGSLSGSMRIRTDVPTNRVDNGTRNLRILQAKDTTYSGVFDGNRKTDRLGTVFVAPGVSSSGTLTLAGVQTHTNDLVVEANAMVNLTGTWVGPVNVYGTISGTGTVDGNLTLNDGATLKVDDLSGALAVSGAFTATGAISIELPEGALSSSRRKCMLLSSTGSVDLSGATFTLTVGDEPVNMADYGFSVFRGRLMLKRNGSVYTIR